MTTQTTTGHVVDVAPAADGPDWFRNCLTHGTQATWPDHPSCMPDQGPSYDELLVDAAKVVIRAQRASASMLQHRLNVGFARATRLLQVLEDNAIVGPLESTTSRRVLVTRDQRRQVLDSLRGAR